MKRHIPRGVATRVMLCGLTRHEVNDRVFMPRDLPMDLDLLGDSLRLLCRSAWRGAPAALEEAA